MPTYNEALADAFTLADAETDTQWFYELKEMINLLGVYLNELNQADHEPFEFNATTLVKFLNKAQDKILTLLDRSLLTDLDVTVSGESLSASGIYDLSTLTQKVFLDNKGLDGIQIVSGLFCQRISFEDYKTYVDSNETFSTTEPKYYVRGNSVYVKPASAHTVDFHYMREPDQMLWIDPSDNNHSQNSYSVKCELDIEISDLIVELAASYGFEYGKDLARAQEAYDTALKNIESLNIKALEAYK